MPKQGAVLIHLPVDLLDQLTRAAKALSMTRSALIRRALEMDLAFITGYELARADHLKRSTAADYRQWLEELFTEASRRGGVV